MRTVFFSFLILVFVCIGVMADDRNATGWGRHSVTVSTTQVYLEVEDPPNTNEVQNSTFADASAWVTGTHWYVTGGSATWSNNVPATNNMYQTINSLVFGAWYRVRFSVTGIDPTTNNVTVIVGTYTGITRTVDGTYTEDFYAKGANSNITFRATATTNGGFAVDNVYARAVPDTAYAFYLQMVNTGVNDIHYLLNTDSNTFESAYLERRTMILSSNYPVTLDMGNHARPIHSIRLKAPVAATMNVNGY